MKLNRYYVDEQRDDGNWVIRDREHGQQIVERHKSRNDARRRVRYYYHLPKGRDDTGAGLDDKPAQGPR